MQPMACVSKMKGWRGFRMRSRYLVFGCAAVALSISVSAVADDLTPQRQAQSLAEQLYAGDDAAAQAAAEQLAALWRDPSTHAPVEWAVFKAREAASDRGERRRQADRLIAEAVLRRADTTELKLRFLDGLTNRYVPVLPDPAIAAPLVAHLWHDDDPRVRMAAVDAFPGDSPQLFGEIRVLLQDPDAEVRKRARAKLWVIDPLGSQSDLLSALSDPDPHTRIQAIGAVRYLVLADERALVERLRDRDPAVRRAALQQLAMLRATEFLREIGAMLEDEDPTNRAVAIQTLTQLRAEEFIPKIIARLGDDDPLVRMRAVEALVTMRVVDYGEMIAKRLDDPDVRVRRAAVSGLTTLEARAFRRQIAAHLTDADPDVRCLAVGALDVFNAQEFADQMSLLLGDTVPCPLLAMTRNLRPTDGASWPTVGDFAKRTLERWSAASAQVAPASSTP